jgi:hypothetical protein
LPVSSPATLWSHKLQAPARGLCLAREKGWLLAWDEKDWLSLFAAGGTSQGQNHQPSAVAACCADDGSALAAIGSDGKVRWLAPDLTPRWERRLAGRGVTAAMDSFGQYLAVSDAQAGLTIFDRQGRTVTQLACPRPFLHLAFVPLTGHIVGSADFGLVACLDLQGKWVWRDGLVMHVGSLAVTGSGDQIILPCYSEGLQRYSLAGGKLAPFSTVEPWKLCAVAFDGQRLLLSGLSKQLYVLEGTGKTAGTFFADSPPVAIALAPLGNTAYVALADGRILALDLQALLPN